MILNRKYTIYKPRLKHRVKMVNPLINISEGKDIMKMITILILIKQHLLQIYSFFSLIHEDDGATGKNEEVIYRLIILMQIFNVFKHRSYEI